MLGSSLFKIHTINSNQIGAIGEVLSEWVHIEIFIHLMSNLFLYEPRHYHCDITDISFNAMWIVRFFFKRANYGAFWLERNVFFLLVKEIFHLLIVWRSTLFKICHKQVSKNDLKLVFRNDFKTHSFINDRIIINRKG